MTLTLDQKKAVYRLVMETEVCDQALDVLIDVSDARFTLRQWDGMDGCWCDLEEKGVSIEIALDAWLRETDGGKTKTSFSEIDYYAIFPADTRMRWDGPGGEMFR